MEDSGVEIMTISEFVLACRQGVFTPDDGTAYWGTKTQEICVFKWEDASPPGGATHIWWYNK